MRYRLSCQLFDVGHIQPSCGRGASKGDCTVLQKQHLCVTGAVLVLLLPLLPQGPVWHQLQAMCANSPDCEPLGADDSDVVVCGSSYESDTGMSE